MQDRLAATGIAGFAMASGGHTKLESTVRYLRIEVDDARICLGRKKINLSQVFAGQNVGIREEEDNMWLVSFMHYDIGYFDLDAGRVEPVENPFGPKVLSMCSV